MSKVKIETLTHVHIGSGEFLKNNSDFVEYRKGNDSYISIIDPKKFLDLIGVDHINDWVNLIERNGNIKDYVARLGKNVSPDVYGTRVLANYALQVNRNDTLKECIHDGMGRAYIPGSSIKGAIRTAVLGVLAEQERGLESLVVSTNPRNGKKTVNSKRVEAKLFGADPNSDIFRFIRVGDAYFEKGCERATRLVNLNIRERNSLYDNSKPQIVEAISVDRESVIQMKVDEIYYEWAKKHWPTNNERIKPLGSMPTRIKKISSLFELINVHTEKLVSDEISYWEQMENNGYEGANGYIENLSSMLDEIRSCSKGKECVLRLGHASGWRFITGAWTEDLHNFESEIIPASRPKNHVYQNFDFPKSRRLDENGDILGFIKMSLYE